MEITIKHILTEEEIKLVLEPTNTVENMKSQACKVMGEAAADYRLQFDVNVILEDEKPLLDYRSQMKTPVFLVPKPRRWKTRETFLNVQHFPSLYFSIYF